MSVNQSSSNTNDNTEPQTLYVGKWTQEEEEYVDGLIESFRAGLIKGLPDGTTLRCWLAKKLSCRVKRVSKRYERTGYNGRAQYKSKEAHLTSQDEYDRVAHKLQAQRQAFLASREQVMQGLAYARGSKRSARTPGMFSRARQAAVASAPPAVRVIRIQEQAPTQPSTSSLEASLAASLASLAAPTSVAPNSSSLLRAALQLKLGATAPAPAPQPALQASPVSALLEVIRVKQQMEQSRMALLERALQSHLLAQALGYPNNQSPINGRPSAA